MKLPEPWVDRIKFTLGVLLVLIGVAFFWGVVDVFSLPDSRNKRLREKQFCVVNNFMASNIFGPTDCYIYDREYQIKPSLDSSAHLYKAEADRETLVMVDYDSEDSKMVKNEHGVEFDNRLVSVYFISGPLSGRNGLIARYKLSQRNFHRP